MQAMSMIRDSKPNLLILDIVMPNKYGCEVCQEIKSDPELQDIQVVMLSSISNEDNINKPFSPMQVVTRIKELLA